MRALLRLWVVGKVVVVAFPMAAGFTEICLAFICIRDHDHLH